MELLLNQSLAWFFQPDMIFMLLIIAKIGFFVEMAYPGHMWSAVIGTVALLLAIVGMFVVTPGWLGLVLYGISFVCLLLELRISTYGLLAIAASVLQIIGGFFLFTGSAQITPWFIWVMGALVGGIGLTLGTFALRAQHMPVKTGKEGMVGERAVVLAELNPEGRVRYGGENWAAIGDTTASIEVGEEVRIVAIEGLRLRVRPAMQKMMP